MVVSRTFLYFILSTATNSSIRRLHRRSLLFDYACLVARLRWLLQECLDGLQTVFCHMLVCEQWLWVCVTFAAALQSNGSFEHSNMSDKVKDKFRLSVRHVMPATNMARWQMYKVCSQCSEQKYSVILLMWIIMFTCSVFLDLLSQTRFMHRV